MEMRPYIHTTRMACVNQAVTHAITTQCCMHIHCVQVACSVWTCKVTSVASRPLLIAWGFGHKGAKTYVLQQDGGDSDMRGGDEAVHLRGAHMACATRAVTRAITLQCHMRMRRVPVACSVWTLAR